MPSHNRIEVGRGIVADASAVINLIASGVFREVARGLSVPMRVVTAVTRELESGRPRWTTSDSLLGLTAEGVVEVVDLSDEASEYFEALVVGPAVETLDDGEAATIAYALANGFEALIDERKAWRICAERYSTLKVTTTVDLLLDAATEAVLGRAGVAEALFQALSLGRMRVPTPHLERVVALIGPQRAALCSSLPLSAREACKQRTF